MGRALKSESRADPISLYTCAPAFMHNLLKIVATFINREALVTRKAQYWGLFHPSGYLYAPTSHTWHLLRPICSRTSRSIEASYLRIVFYICFEPSSRSVYTNYLAGVSRALTEPNLQNFTWGCSFPVVSIHNISE